MVARNSSHREAHRGGRRGQRGPPPPEVVSDDPLSFRDMARRCAALAPRDEEGLSEHGRKRIDECGRALRKLEDPFGLVGLDRPQRREPSNRTDLVAVARAAKTKARRNAFAAPASLPRTWIGRPPWSARAADASRWRRCTWSEIALPCGVRRRRRCCRQPGFGFGGVVGGSERVGFAPGGVQTVRNQWETCAGSSLWFLTCCLVHRDSADTLGRRSACSSWRGGSNFDRGSCSGNNWPVTRKKENEQQLGR